MFGKVLFLSAVAVAAFAGLKTRPFYSLTGACHDMSSWSEIDRIRKNNRRNKIQRRRQ